MRPLVCKDDAIKRGPGGQHLGLNRREHTRTASLVWVEQLLAITQIL